MNLKLFTNLQSNDIVSLVLQPSVDGYLKYYLISGAVNYGVVLSGECEGTLESDKPMSFDLSLSAIAPLISKGHDFSISYTNGVLKFNEVKGRFSVEPLCIETLSDMSVNLMERFIGHSDRMSAYNDTMVKIEELNEKLSYYKANYNNALSLSFKSYVNDPWTEPSKEEPDRVEEFKLKVAECEAAITDLKNQMQGIGGVDYSMFTRIAEIASKNNTTVSLCEDFALVTLANSYVIQKGKCGIRSLNGKIFHRLLKETTGVFYDDEDALTFFETFGKGKQRNSIYVVFYTYLPNWTVDSTIITRGAVREKYSIKMQSAVSILAPVLSKFQDMSLDFGEAKIYLSNDRGERIVYNMEVEDAKTLALNKMMRGEEVGAVTMSTVKVPREVQFLMGYMVENFTVYVKQKKIVIQSGGLYIVFGSVS